MTITIVSILFIVVIFYLIFKNTLLNETKNKPLLLFKSVLKGLLLYSLFGYIIAHIIIVYKDSHHPHSMIGLLYIFIPLYGAALGILLGIIYASFGNKHNINKKLVYSMPIYLLLLLGYVLLMSM